LPSIVHSVEDYDAFAACWVPAKESIGDKDWRDYAARVTHWSPCADVGSFGHALNRALRNGTNVVFVVTGARFFANADLLPMAEKLLAASFGQGAVYLSGGPSA